MRHRWATGFTIVELMITILVIGILVAISIVGYAGVRKLALSTAAQSDLQNVATAMSNERLHKGSFPDSLPDTIEPSNRIQLNFIRSGALPYYENLTPVQSGSLFAQICSDLVTEGYGKGTSQGGQLRDYITGCGNWNHDSMQFTGWDSKVWDTPVEKQVLLDYANNFTATAWDIDQERVIKSFYGQVVDRYEQMGGEFPITSFWDYWATSSNGGVLPEPLDPDAPTKAYYCVEATIQDYPTLFWHVTQSGKVEGGSC